MKSLKQLVLAVAFAAMSVAAVSAAHANPATPRIDRREAKQHQRIVQGVRQGQLTRGETRQLVKGQRHVHRMERRAKADGVMTGRERVRINRAQNHQSRHIARLKHNGRVRPGVK